MTAALDFRTNIVRLRAETRETRRIAKSCADAHRAIMERNAHDAVDPFAVFDADDAARGL